jgi:hypothetical protein
MHQFDDGSKKGGLFSWKNHEDSMKWWSCFVLQSTSSY